MKREVVIDRFRESGADDSSACNTVDLHCHTSRSDGVLSAVALYGIATTSHMQAIAIADHDTVQGLRDLAVAGVTAGVDGAPLVVPAIEINCMEDGDSDDAKSELHVLGYGIDVNDVGLEAVLRRQRLLRTSRFEEIVERLRAMNRPVDNIIESIITDDVEAAGRPHVARALVAAGHATSVSDAFARFLVRGQPCYVPRRGLTASEAIDAVRAARGLPVLAHFAEAIENEDLLDVLTDWGLAGLEVHYRRYPANVRERLAEVASRRGLLATGGSDFHAPPPDFPDVQAHRYVPQGTLEQLLKALSVEGSPTVQRPTVGQLHPHP